MCSGLTIEFSGTPRALLQVLTSQRHFWGGNCQRWHTQGWWQQTCPRYLSPPANPKCFPVRTELTGKLGPWEYSDSGSNSDTSKTVWNWFLRTYESATGKVVSPLSGYICLFNSVHVSLTDTHTQAYYSLAVKHYSPKCQEMNLFLLLNSLNPQRVFHFNLNAAIIACWINTTEILSTLALVR